MTDFYKYQSLERFGTTEVAGIEDGRCFVFPKIDGTNASVWTCENGLIYGGSRNRKLDLENDNAGFLAAIQNDENIKSFFSKHPDKRLYGEWLVPHSLKTYRDETWRKFYVFDVATVDGENLKYIPYETYKEWLDEDNIEYIPPIFVVNNPTEERLFSALQQNNYLIKDGSGTGEGVVIKNYDFVNKFGRTTWAKIVSSEFKAKHTKALGFREIKEKVQIEDQIAAEFVTHALVEKTYAKIALNGFSSKNIPQLLNTVFYDIIREDMWEIIKKFKNPEIDFAKLQRAVFAHTKIYKPELFN